MFVETDSMADRLASNALIERFAQHPPRARMAAMMQKAVIAYLLVLPAAIITAPLLLRANHLMQAFFLYSFLAITVGATVALLLMCLAAFGTVLGIITFIFSLVPLAGVAVILVVNGEVTAALRGHGYRVGLLGVPWRALQQDPDALAEEPVSPDP